MRCLVVEDDPDIGADLKRSLEAAGFSVDIVGDGDTAWYQGDVENYDAAVLDLGLPRLDGLSVLRKWRAAGRAFPVIVLSARGDWTEKVEGIEAGADDYLSKPFEMGELIARLRGVVRRGAGRVSNVVVIGGLRLDTTRMSAVFNGAHVLQAEHALAARLAALVPDALNATDTASTKLIVAGLVSVASIAGFKSRPTTRPLPANRSATARATTPVPHATSSTSCPARSPAVPTTSSLQLANNAGTNRAS